MIVCTYGIAGSVLLVVIRGCNVAQPRCVHVGKRISEEELNGSDRAEYGMEVIKKLSDTLVKKYGEGFSKRSLYKYQQFYKAHPNSYEYIKSNVYNKVSKFI